MLTRFKSKPGIQGSDPFLQGLIDEAEEFAMTYTKQNKEFIEKNLSGAVVELAVLSYNRQGNEGLESQAYSGVSEHYTDDIPQVILTKLNRFRRCF